MAAAAEIEQAHHHQQQQGDVHCIAPSTLLLNDAHEIVEVHAAPVGVHPRLLEALHSQTSNSSRDEAAKTGSVKSDGQSSEQSLRRLPSNVYDNRPKFSAMAQRRHSKLVLSDSDVLPLPMQLGDDPAAASTASGFLTKISQWRPKVINPHKRWYQVFWHATLMYALVNAAVDPYKVAFGPAGGLEPYNDVWAVLEYIGTVLFLVDIALKFFVAFEDAETKQLVTDQRSITLNYLRLFFWLDLLFWFPFVGVINAAMPHLTAPSATSYSDYAELPDSETNAALYVGLLSFLKLGRLYRIFYFFELMDHSMVMSQMALMLTRNFFYILLTCHWFACIFYFTARVEHFSPTRSWVGRRLNRFDGQSTVTIYIYSFYLSVISFTSLGDSDFFSNSPAESMIMSIYLLFNVVLGAYILGTVTMLMVKGDERSSKFRDRIMNLKTYSMLNELPGDIQDAMRKHIELHFQSELSSDELVLATYPAAIKKRVLRHMYLKPLQDCYIFKSCLPKFLDAILAVCRTELFMPNVQLVTEGDIVSDLSLVIDGEVEVIPMAGEGSSSGPALSRHLLLAAGASTGGSQHGSQHNKARRSSFFIAPADVPANMKSFGRQSVGSHGGNADSEKRGVAETFGEVAFFTESPSTDAVWTCAITRVLVLPRAAYDELVKAYPNQVRQVLGAVYVHAEKAMIQELMDLLDSIPVTTNSLHVRMFDFLNVGGNLGTLDLPTPILKELQALMNTEQLKKLEQLEVIKNSYKRFCAKQDQALVVDLLNYAKRGEEEGMNTLLAQGVDPSCADFDHRTPLMIAAREGREAIVRTLLESGADVHKRDCFGNTALCEAVKKGRDDVVALLLGAGAKLDECTAAIQDFVIQTVMSGNVDVLLKLLHAGADPNIHSFDKRSLLHLAASEGNLGIVRALVEAGARTDAVDRWNQLPVDDAERFKAQEVHDYLQVLTAPRKSEEGVRKLASTVGRQSMIQRKSMRTRRVSVVNIPAHKRGALPHLTSPKGAAPAHGHAAPRGPQTGSRAASLDVDTQHDSPSDGAGAKVSRPVLLSDDTALVNDSAGDTEQMAPARNGLDLSPVHPVIKALARSDKLMQSLDSESMDCTEDDVEDVALEAQLAVEELTQATQRLASVSSCTPPRVWSSAAQQQQQQQQQQDEQQEAVNDTLMAAQQAVTALAHAAVRLAREGGEAAALSQRGSLRGSLRGSRRGNELGGQCRSGASTPKCRFEGDEAEPPEAQGLSLALVHAQLAVAAAAAAAAPGNDKQAWVGEDAEPGGLTATGGQAMVSSLQTPVELMLQPSSPQPGSPSGSCIRTLPDHEATVPGCAASPRLLSWQDLTKEAAQAEEGSSVQPATSPASGPPAEPR